MKTTRNGGAAEGRTNEQQKLCTKAEQKLQVILKQFAMGLQPKIMMMMMIEPRCTRDGPKSTCSVHSYNIICAIMWAEALRRRVESEKPIQDTDHQWTTTNTRKRDPILLFTALPPVLFEYLCGGYYGCCCSMVMHGMR